MTAAMSTVNYRLADFNSELNIKQIPWMIDRHVIYPLQWDEEDEVMVCCRSSSGDPLMSPRCLKEIVANNLVTKSSINLSEIQLPIEMHKLLLTEAILQSEIENIEYLVSHWPEQTFCVKECIPPEDNYAEDTTFSITTSLDGSHNMTLLDCILRALLTLSPNSPLRCVDLSHFVDGNCFESHLKSGERESSTFRKKDQKVEHPFLHFSKPNLCKEVFRLPLLWLRPERRAVEKIYPRVRTFMSMSRDKVRRYLNRIRKIYTFVDDEQLHEQVNSPIDIILPCKLTIDDVAIGLVLQDLSPFTFCCEKLWLSSIPDVRIQMSQARNLLNHPKSLTQLEIRSASEEMEIQATFTLQDILQGVLSLPSLTCLSIMGGIDGTAEPSIILLLIKSLQGLPNLRRLGLSSCILRGKLSAVLSELKELEYLNLSDCRLQKEDVEALIVWPHIHQLRELNLSNNNLRDLESELIAIVKQMHNVVCMCISYCCVSYETLDKLVYICSTFHELKVLEMQTFTPLPSNQLRRLLYFVAKTIRMQKCKLLPQTYAFLGDNESERHHLKVLTIASCYYYLESKGRPDILVC